MIPEPPDESKNVAIDWIVNWAADKNDEAVAHFYHICDGNSRNCGCQFEGNTFG